MRTGIGIGKGIRMAGPIITPATIGIGILAAESARKKVMAEEGTVGNPKVFELIEQEIITGEPMNLTYGLPHSIVNRYLEIGSRGLKMLKEARGKWLEETKLTPAQEEKIEKTRELYKFARQQAEQDLVPKPPSDPSVLARDLDVSSAARMKRTLMETPGPEGISPQQTFMSRDDEREQPGPLRVTIKPGPNAFINQ